MTAPPEKKSFWQKISAGFSRSATKLGEGLASIITKRPLDEAMLEEMETLLLSGDMGVRVTQRLIADLRKARFGKETDSEDVKSVLAQSITTILQPVQQSFVLSEQKPFVILMAGVNGAGKTTTIGKLAARFKGEGKNVWLAAGDTFRAAAVEQLKIWGARTGCEVVAGQPGADAAGLAYTAFEQARAAGADVLLLDTAGRLQNKSELMAELAKIVKVIKKLDPTAPHASVLTLDATVGQNAHSQVKLFSEIIPLSGLVMTKLDGTAKGGVLVALADAFRLPVFWIGLGEGVEDLRDFSAEHAARALVGLANGI